MGGRTEDLDACRCSRRLAGFHEGRPSGLEAGQRRRQAHRCNFRLAFARLFTLVLVWSMPVSAAKQAATRTCYTDTGLHQMPPNPIPHARAGQVLERLNGTSVSKVIGQKFFNDVDYIREMLKEVRVIFHCWACQVSLKPIFRKQEHIFQSF
jgi:esterase/lipase superfamily enzyme